MGVYGEKGGYFMFEYFMSFISHYLRQLVSHTGAPQPCAEFLGAYTGASQPRFYIVSKT